VKPAGAICGVVAVVEVLSKPRSAPPYGWVRSVTPWSRTTWSV